MIRPLVTRLAAKPFQRPIQSLFKASVPRSKPLVSSPFLFPPLVRPFTAQNVATVSGSVARRTTNWPKVLGQLGIIGGTVVGLNLFLNREGRDGGIPPNERAYLNQTFKYTGASLGITALSAFALFRAGFAFHIMSMNRWAALGLGLVATIGTMVGTIRTDPANTVQKHAFWTAFSVSQALLLSPLFFYSPALLGRAALYTVGMVGSLSYVAATAKTDTYLYWGGPLVAGLSVVILTSFAPMVLPVTAARTLALSESIAVYGGLAVFGGFVMYDVQRIMLNARLGYKDPVAESIGLELDFINIFVRFVAILARSRQK